ncbi:MAG: hypothetical protein HBSIN02_07790 [Bacteroidia bacterium]|nr:MAG: hypothetical protein HBSIN02_07790 [Bacteroidia bacterium]
MKPSSLFFGLIILAFPAQALKGQVSSFPYSQDFTADPLGTDWTVSNSGVGANNWSYSASDGNTGGCLKLTGYITAGGDENYLHLALNTSSATFTGGETFTYEIFRETGALGDATIVVQQNASGSFVDIPGSSYSINSLTATTWTTKTVSLPPAMENKTNVTLRLKISGTLSLAFDNLRLDNASLSGGVLPIQITSFSASAGRLDVFLKWSTATELKNYGFEIERRHTSTSPSLPPTGWSRIGFVQGAGTSNAPRQYTFTDHNVPPGRYAYRIKQIDHDGTIHYFGDAELEIGLGPKKFTLSEGYPNPFNPLTTIEFTLPDDGRAVLSIYNALGQRVAVLFDGEALAGRIVQAQFDASRFPSGIYFSRLEYGGKALTRKIVLLK